LFDALLEAGPALLPATQNGFKGVGTRVFDNKRDSLLGFLVLLTNFAAILKLSIRVLICYLPKILLF
jgi:hypothetical protein